MQKILVTGACGYLGPSFIEEFLKRGLDVVGLNNPSSQRKGNVSRFLGEDSFTAVDGDVRDTKKLEEVIEAYSIDTVFHFASVISVKGEEDPLLTWDVNVNGLWNIVRMAKKYNLKVFWPSSLSVFGASSPKINTPQDAVLKPTTVYGTTKVVGEQILGYFCPHLGVDVRSIRYVGNISHHDIPMGSITGYAVEMLHSAVRDGEYVCYLKEDTILPLVYLPDTIKVTMNLMEGHRVRCGSVAFNQNAFSFSPKELEGEIKNHIRGFKCRYQPDNKRQLIANYWPQSLDDSIFRKYIQWKPEFDFCSMVEDMIKNLRMKYNT